ncbi:MAG: FKBP-type peptidyl-prolyl cis-trans isomerase [Oscillospiraceae bacterium]|nr:FKBP-type peptidyl-prolyl cis-trans isomerase [Oscillospiraceae bacterium]
MNSKAKMKKNLTRLVCLVLAAIMLIGCFAYFTMEEVETHDYSAGLTEEGFFEGITALDNVVLPDYHAYTIPEDATIATEDEINSKIHTEILSAYATQEKDTDADRVVKDGDSINIDFDGKIDGVAFEGGSTGGAGNDVTIGSGRFIEGFEEQIIGHKAGETFDINVTFPEDYGNEELNGKDAVFTITVNHLYNTVIPELTEDFVKEKLSEHYEDVADLKAQVAESIVDADTKNHIWGKLMDETTVTSYPQQIHDYEVAARKANLELTASQWGIGLEGLLSLYGCETMDDYVALEDVAADIKDFEKVYLTVQAVAEKEGWRVSEEDMKEYFSTMFGTEDYSDYEKVYGKPYLKSIVIRDIILNNLVENAEVVPATAE